jgi:hypothetical protein
MDCEPGKELRMATKRPTMINFSRIGNIDIGFLTVAQAPDVPFSIRRAYWVYDTPMETERGNHAHRLLEQLIFCLAGQLTLILEDGLGWTRKFCLDEPSVAVYIPPGYWRRINFSKGSVLLCLASQEYDESDYIRDYGAFLDFAKGEER